MFLSQTSMNAQGTTGTVSRVVIIALGATAAHVHLATPLLLIADHVQVGSRRQQGIWTSQLS